LKPCDQIRSRRKVPELEVVRGLVRFLLRAGRRQGMITADSLVFPAWRHGAEKPAPNSAGFSI